MVSRQLRQVFSAGLLLAFLAIHLADSIPVPQASNLPGAPGAGEEVEVDDLAESNNGISSNNGKASEDFGDVRRRRRRSVGDGPAGVDDRGDDSPADESFSNSGREKRNVASDDLNDDKGGKDGGDAAETDEGRHDVRKRRSYLSDVTDYVSEGERDRDVREGNYGALTAKRQQGVFDDAGDDFIAGNGGGFPSSNVDFRKRRSVTDDARDDAGDDVTRKSSQRFVSGQSNRQHTLDDASETGKGEKNDM